MLKQSLYFANPFHLSTELKQLVITNKESGEVKKRPIEDLGFVVLDNQQITMTQSVMQQLAENNVAVVICDDKHHPASMLFHLDTNQVQNERFRAQVEASEPLRKQLWQQTVKAKINNQAMMLKRIGQDHDDLLYLARQVKSGDTTNEEAQAARRYWSKLFGNDFRRERFGMPPNPSLNYGYAYLRAAVARALSGSGLLPTLGIHHHNKYNAYCLADDIMEPYRPFVDLLVYEQKQKHDDYHYINKDRKMEFLALLGSDVIINDKNRPLMVALSETTSSLAACFEGRETIVKYPIFKV